MNADNKLVLAIQKDGRLQEKSLHLLNEAGVDVDKDSKQLVYHCKKIPLDILFLRNKDIPEYVIDGVADCAVLGENVNIESGNHLDKLLELEFGHCHLSIAVPKDFKYNSLKDISQKKIATSYPNTLNTFLVKNKIKASIYEISGSVEVTPKIGLADVICDLVSTGSTLMTNGLIEVHKILDSQACLFKRRKLSVAKTKILNHLVFRLQAVVSAKHNSYIMLNTPNDCIQKISALLPGFKSLQ